jgi:hypothetical protein
MDQNSQNNKQGGFDKSNPYKEKMGPGPIFHIV